MFLIWGGYTFWKEDLGNASDSRRNVPLRIIKDKGEIPLWKPFSILAIMNAEIIAVLQKRSSRVAFERMLREEPT